jgi:hypothetical protein
MRVRGVGVRVGVHRFPRLDEPRIVGPHRQRRRDHAGRGRIEQRERQRVVVGVARNGPHDVRVVVDRAHGAEFAEERRAHVRLRRLLRAKC